MQVVESIKAIAQTQACVTLTVGRLVGSPSHESNERNPAFHFSIAPSLPPGLTIDSTSGAICGSPTMCTSPHVYTLICRGADGTTVSKGIIVEVVEATSHDSGDDDSAANTILTVDEESEPPRRCASDPGSDLNRQMLTILNPGVQTAGLRRSASWRDVLCQPTIRSACFSPSRGRSPSPLRSAADAAVLVPLGPRLALALCDGDEARRVLRGRRMGRAAFIAASAALEGPVRLLPASPHAVLAIT